LSEARLEEAVTRILTLKARLGLHRTIAAERLPDNSPALRAPEHVALAARTSARSLTLVKDVAGLLPLDPAAFRRVVLLDEGEEPTFIDGAPKRSFAPLIAGLEAAGFVVRRYDPAHPPTREDTDLLLYFVGHESTPVVASNRIDWVALHGGAKKAMTRFWPAIPTVMVSFGYPYLLYEAPDVPTYVNAYSAIPAVQAALVAALTGEAAFPGVSPVDPFCGQAAARF
jgi:beta-N-acetylhexosaminidase